MQNGGLEWLVEAHGCNQGALTDVRKLEGMFRRLLRDLRLTALGSTRWHQFPNTGGVTGLCLLAESHLTCHTFPEYGSLCLNLFCCTSRPDADFDALIKEEFNAAHVYVRRVDRPYRPEAPAAADAPAPVP